MKEKISTIIFYVTITSCLATWTDRPSVNVDDFEGELYDLLNNQLFNDNQNSRLFNDNQNTSGNNTINSPKPPAFDNSCKRECMITTADNVAKPKKVKTNSTTGSTISSTADIPINSMTNIPANPTTSSTAAIAKDIIGFDDYRNAIPYGSSDEDKHRISQSILLTEYLKNDNTVDYDKIYSILLVSCTPLSNNFNHTVNTYALDVNNNEKILTARDCIKILNDWIIRHGHNMIPKKTVLQKQASSNSTNDINDWYYFKTFFRDRVHINSIFTSADPIMVLLYVNSLNSSWSVDEIRSLSALVKLMRKGELFRSDEDLEIAKICLTKAKNNTKAKNKTEVESLSLRSIFVYLTSIFGSKYYSIILKETAERSFKDKKNIKIFNARLEFFTSVEFSKLYIDILDELYSLGDRNKNKYHEIHKKYLNEIDKVLQEYFERILDVVGRNKTTKLPAGYESSFELSVVRNHHRLYKNEHSIANETRFYDNFQTNVNRILKKWNGEIDSKVANNVMPREECFALKYMIFNATSSIINMVDILISLLKVIGIQKGRRTPTRMGYFTKLDRAFSAVICHQLDPERICILFEKLFERNNNNNNIFQMRLVDISD